MKTSAKIVLRQPARRDGTCLLRLQVIINGTVVPVGLNIGWWPQLFDEATGRCLDALPVARRPAGYKALLDAGEAVAGDGGLAKRAADYNLIAGQALGRANEVLVEFRLSKAPLTVAGFLEEYNQEASKTDFIQYYKKKMDDRLRRGHMKKTTWISHNATLNVLKVFRPTLPFYTLSHKFADDFHDFVRTVSPGPNTWWGRHKNVKGYLNQARRDRIKFEDPYRDFKNKSVPGSWRALPPAEVVALETYYQTCAAGTAHRRILQRFLFSCFSSLRLSDLKLIQHAALSADALTFRIQKTYSKKLREMLLPLTHKALRYLHEAQEEHGKPGFYNYTDQYANRVLKEIGAALGLTTRMHHHVGRETFGTDFIRRGGSVAVLQKLLDHEKIETTMKYVHIDDGMKYAAIAALNAADAAEDGSNALTVSPVLLNPAANAQNWAVGP